MLLGSEPQKSSRSRMAHFLALLCIRKCLDNFYFTLDYLEKMHRFLKFVKDQKDSSCFFLSVWFATTKEKSNRLAANLVQ